MLSKIRGLFRRADVNFQKNLLLVLERELEKRYGDCSITPLDSTGTLGIFFHGVVGGQKKFVKTHLPYGDNRLNLLKEAEILDFLYGEDLGITLLECATGNLPQAFLIMDECEPISSPAKKNTVLELIESFQKRVDEKKTADWNERWNMHSLHTLLDEGRLALSLLKDSGLVNDDIWERCSDNLSLLRTTDSNAISTLCHGDLSNRNIMRRKNRLYIVDWEDAFVGEDRYDFCYWLTFFDQRRYYSGISEHRFLYKKDIARMVLVLLLKCLLSYKNESFRTNSLTFDERIGEVLCIKTRD